MGFVDDDGEVSIGQLPVGEDLLHRVGEGLDRHHNDRGAALQGFGQLGRFALAGVLLANGGDQILLVVDLLDGVLQLFVQRPALCDHDDRMEQACACIRAQADQIVCCPGDGAGLAGACRVFAEVGLARALALGVLDHAGDGLPLVEAREDLRFLLLVVAGQVDDLLLLRVHEAVEDPQPVVAVANLLPEVGDRILAILADRVALAAIAPLVEGQEVAVLAIELGAHLDVAVRHGEVDDRATLEGEQWFLPACGRIHRQAVVHVLGHGRFGGLGEVGLDLHRGHGQAVDEKHQIDGQRAARAVHELRHDTQDVGVVAIPGGRVARILGQAFA